MYKLILHHTYKLGGSPLDISCSGNNGRRTGTSFIAGRLPDSGALYFKGGNDNVVVPANDSLKMLKAIQIEAWICIDDLSTRRNIIEGSRSFEFSVNSDGTLYGACFDPWHIYPYEPGHPSFMPGPTWIGVTSDVVFSPDGKKHTVPLNTWTHVKYIHDGVASAKLYINDVLVGANNDICKSVCSVGDRGLAIGHSSDPYNDRYTMHGSIDEVKLWKYDPDVMPKQFYSRPMNSKQLKCWGNVFYCLKKQAAGENGKELIHFIKCIMQAQDELIRSIRLKGEAAIAEQNSFAESYQELWCKGNITGDHMRELLNSYAAWLSENTTFEERILWRKRFQSCLKSFNMQEKMEEELNDINVQMTECDPQFVNFLRLVLMECRELFGMSPRGA